MACIFPEMGRAGFLRYGLEEPLVSGIIVVCESSEEFSTSTVDVLEYKSTD